MRRILTRLGTETHPIASPDAPAAWRGGRTGGETYQRSSGQPGGERRPAISVGRGPGWTLRPVLKARVVHRQEGAELRFAQGGTSGHGELPGVRHGSNPRRPLFGRWPYNVPRKCRAHVSTTPRGSLAARARRALTPADTQRRRHRWTASGGREQTEPSRSAGCRGRDSRPAWHHGNTPMGPSTKARSKLSSPGARNTRPRRMLTF